MEFKQALNILKEKDEFKEFKKENPSYFVVHGFLTREDSSDEGWQIGFYSEENDNIVVFETEPVERLPEDDAFKKQGSINPLDVEKIKFNLEEALEKAEKIREKEYAGQTVTKKIVVLQKLEEQIWNITLVTASFNIINIRLNTETGDLVSKKIESIMKLGKNL